MVVLQAKVYPLALMSMTYNHDTKLDAIADLLYSEQDLFWFLVLSTEHHVSCQPRHNIKYYAASLVQPDRLFQPSALKVMRNRRGAMAIPFRTWQAYSCRFSKAHLLVSCAGAVLYSPVTAREDTPFPPQTELSRPAR